MKYVTFSYDDGVFSDIKLLEILNKYGAKCTFNLNSGLMDESRQWVFNNSFIVKQLGKNVIRNLYSGHEIASHSATHPHLEKLTSAEIKKEIEDDVKKLEDMYETRVSGFAYPYGTYDDRVIEALGECGISYARTVEVTHDFARPTNPLLWKTTCHHRDPKLFELADFFHDLPANGEDRIFSIWGHSYEFDGYDGWPLFESIVATFSNMKDIVFCTNSQALL